MDGLGSAMLPLIMISGCLLLLGNLWFSRKFNSELQDELGRSRTEMQVAVEQGNSCGRDLKLAADRVSQSEQEVEELKTRGGEQVAENERLRTELESANRIAEEEQGKAEKVEEERAGVQQQAEEKQAEIERLSAEIAQLETENAETKSKLDKLVAMAEEEEAKAEEKRKLILEEKRRVEEARKKILEENSANNANKDKVVTDKETSGNATVASSDGSRGTEESKVEGDEGEDELKEQVAAPDNANERTEGATDVDEEAKTDDEVDNGEKVEGEREEDAGDDVEEEKEDDDKGERSPDDEEDQESSFEPAKFNLMTGSSSSSAASIGSVDTR